MFDDEMKKWTLAFLVLALVVAFYLWRRDAVRISYVNGLAAYTSLPGKEYILERDCYIFKFKSRQPDWPYLASHLSVPDLPETVEEKNIGIALPNVDILDVARTGSHFKIVSVRRDESRTKVSITFEVLFTNENEREYARVDLYWMLDHTPEQKGLAPTLINGYAVERTGL